MKFQHIDPAAISESERHKLLIGAVTPRPIAFVSTRSVDGKDNLAPFSFYNAIGSTPMTLLFCPGYRSDGTPKDSLINSLPPSEGGLGEFVINAAVEAHAREIGASAKGLDHGDSEFALTGLTPEPSRVVAPPRVAEAPVSFECKTIRAFQVDETQPTSSFIVIGRVVHAWVREDLIDERYRIDPDKLATIGRMGGPEYALTRERFQLARGSDALTAPLPFSPHGMPGVEE